MQLEDLLKLDFSNGTLVEYEMYSKFSKEWQRAKVISVELEKNDNSDYFHIKTDGKPMYRCIMEGIGKGYIANIINGVYYINGGAYLSTCFALAPNGVEIPSPKDNQFYIS